MDAILITCAPPLNPVVKTEPTEEGQLLETEELSIHSLKVEPKDEEPENTEHQLSSDAQESEENSKTDKIITLQHKVQEVLLPEQSSHDFALISDLYNLLDDYRSMACSNKSLLCSQVPVCQALLTCQLCGKQFMGKADRLLKLCKHFELVHPVVSTGLILEAMGRYDLLIRHMRKALQFDEWFTMRYYKNNHKVLQLSLS